MSAGSPVASYPLANRILAELGEQMPFLLRATNTAAGPPLAERLPELEYIAERLEAINDSEDWIANSVRAYVLLSLEVLKLQHKLEKTGRYLLSNEREAYERVYSRGDVIGSYYLAGLLLTQALWPTHFAMSSAFRHEFVPAVPPAARVMEIGVGTGYHLRRFFESSPGIRYQGVDISQFSIDSARRFAFDEDVVGVAFSLQNAADGLDFEPASFDAAICGEVIEHVEDPRAMLAEIRRVLKPDARFFMTTAIFAAHIDHIYLFENAQQVRELIAESGWRLEREWVFPVYAGSSEESHRPMSYASILRPA